jgi:AcrR family transcriptional regulator
MAGRSPTSAPGAAGLPAASSLPRRLLGREARREVILRSAAEAFADRGYAATSMEEVAGAAGITRLIVYRHFASKRELYDAVLERVADRLRDEFTAELRPGRVGEGAVRALLTVARENPAGFSLLWRHAAREPQFTEHADAIRARVVAGAETLLERVPAGQHLPRTWAAATLVAYLVEATLAWLNEGRPEADETFVKRMASSLPALVRAWSDRD